jgi:hypothetical protein
MGARWSVLTVVAACGGHAAPQRPAPKPAPRAAPPEPVCIASPDEDARIAHATADGATVRYCVGDATDRCFALDLASGKLARAAAPAAAAPAPDGGVAVVTPNPGVAEVWDAAKTKKLASFRYGRGDFKCGKVALLGATIYVSASACEQPAARGALYSQKGTKIANVGGKDFGTYGEAFVQLDDTTWAFLEESGNLLAVQDVAKGKVQKTIALAALWQSRNAEMGNPGESALVKLADGKLAVIAGAPATGSIALITVATGEVSVVTAPLCGSL